MADTQPDEKPESSPDEANPAEGKQEEPTNASDEKPTGDMVPRTRLNEVAQARDEWKQKFEEATAEKPGEKPQEDAPASPQGMSARDVLKLRTEGFSDSEILQIEEQSESLGIPVPKLLENDLFKAGLTAKREETKAEDATPAPSTAPSVKVGDKSWDDMTNDERKAAWSEVGNQFRDKGVKTRT